MAAFTSCSREFGGEDIEDLPVATKSEPAELVIHFDGVDSQSGTTDTATSSDDTGGRVPDNDATVADATAAAISTLVRSDNDVGATSVINTRALDTDLRTAYRTKPLIFLFDSDGAVVSKTEVSNARNALRFAWSDTKSVATENRDITTGISKVVMIVNVLPIIIDLDRVNTYNDLLQIEAAFSSLALYYKDPRALMIWMSASQDVQWTSRTNGLWTNEITLHPAPVPARIDVKVDASAISVGIPGKNVSDFYQFQGVAALHTAKRATLVPPFDTPNLEKGQNPYYSGLSPKSVGDANWALQESNSDQFTQLNTESLLYGNWNGAWNLKKNTQNGIFQRSFFILPVNKNSWRRTDEKPPVIVVWAKFDPSGSGNYTENRYFTVELSSQQPEFQKATGGEPVKNGYIYSINITLQGAIAGTGADAEIGARQTPETASAGKGMSVSITPSIWLP
ncbi:MAG: hypothetical protein LBR06_01830 [Bacteroidales bacterium]|nr:hypothetical protein [Bacteroidales bacterium]